MKITYTFKVFIFFVAVILSGCSANNQLRRAKKLIAKAELNGAVWSSDTVMVRVPVILTETVVDSILITKPGDTVYLNRDRLSVKYVRLKGDSIFIQGKCKADTVKVEVPVTVTKVVSAAKSWMSNWVLFLLIGFSVGVFACFFLRKK